MVNVIIKGYTPRGQNKRMCLRNHLNYLHRVKDVSERFCSHPFDDKAFVKVFGNRDTELLIVSPRKETDMKELCSKVVEGITLFNHKKSLDYVCYLHNDTKHPHLHFVISKKNGDSLDLSTNFLKNYLYPYINNYLTSVYGKESKENEREDYINSLYNMGASRIDYDIKRATKKDKSGKFLVFDEEMAKAKNEEWKLFYIRERLRVLMEDNFATVIKGKIVLLKDFIKRKIAKGKIYLHLQNTSLPIKESEVKEEYVKKEDIKEVLSVIEKKHITSFLVKTKEEKICFFEKKKRKEDKGEER